MAEIINLLDLVPTDRQQVKFPNGKVFDLVHMEEMEPSQYAVIIQQQNRAEELRDALDGAGLGKPEEAVQNMDEMHGILGDLLKGLMPDLDDETLKGTPLFMRAHVMERWAESSKGVPKVLGQESQN